MLKNKDHIKDICKNDKKENEIYSLDVINHKDEIYRIGCRLHKRKKGEVLCPEIEPLESLLEMQRTMTEYNFLSQYQQDPIPAKGNIINFDDFQRYDYIPSSKYATTIQSWDIALTSSQNNDYSVCVTGTLIEGVVYIRDILRVKLDSVRLEDKIIDQRLAYNTDYTLIEQSTASLSLIQCLQSKSIPITPILARDSKEARAQSAAHYVKNGTIKLPKSACWLEDFKSECQTFPFGKHDDQIDAFTQLANYLNEIIMHKNRINGLSKLREETLEEKVEKIFGIQTDWEAYYKMTPLEREAYD